ncbi:MAG: hypothetical protein KC609_21815 [Myxococcales bacterium]|nr:hypothetical protein [Myxococcales bacterium]
MDLNVYERAIVNNADWFIAMEDERGFIAVPSDEYYGVPGDASLIGHSMSVRTFAWYLTGDERYLESARRSARWLAERQDERGGWRHDAGFALDAAQCVMEGFASLERLTGDRGFHEVLVKATDRMISGTVRDDGQLLIGNLTECGEYAHFAFLAWRLTGLERHLAGGHRILEAITSQFDEEAGYWNTVGAIDVPKWMELSRFCLSPIVRASVSRMQLKGKTVAKISELIMPLVINGRGPQYALGMMDAESLLDTLDGRLELPRLRQQVERGLRFVETYCAGPLAGSFCESRDVPASIAVYPLPAINDATNASLWPTAATLLGYVGMQDPSYHERAKAVADWLVSMQDDDGSFYTHQAPDGRRFGEKYGNINFYGSVALWTYNAAVVRQTLHPTLFPAP